MRYLLTLLVLLQIVFGSGSASALTLELDDIVEAIRAEFVEQGFDDNVELELFGGQTKFDLGNITDAKILLSNFSAVEDDDKFTVDAEIFADGKSVATTKLVGRYFVLEKVLVPTKDITKDEIIKKENLTQIIIRSNRLRDDVIKEENNLLGKQAIRTIKEGKPITSRDIRDEIVIKKGQMIMVVYKYKGLQITSKMEAIEDGAKGQRIRLINNKSNKEVIGRVVDKNMVEVLGE
ncbi:MAG: flagellar basal body P-ring formation protein FlgA [Alphaproteobacteria bacterium]|nr:flagellar basal body P-ring formation protein FlgA [Alphaproteobacteria bacterium]